jgi:hypothetical protein
MSMTLLSVASLIGFFVIVVLAMRGGNRKDGQKARPAGSQTRRAVAKPKLNAYVPGQNEPQEYTKYTAQMLAMLQLGALEDTVLVVGFDDDTKVSSVLAKTARQLGCGSAVKGPDFERRNPVIECRYSTSTPASTIVGDAEKLKKAGATDLSAFGVEMGTALKLREIFGQKSCVNIGVVQKR